MPVPTRMLALALSVAVAFAFAATGNAAAANDCAALRAHAAAAQRALADADAARDRGDEALARARADAADRELKSALDAGSPDTCLNRHDYQGFFAVEFHNWVYNPVPHGDPVAAVATATLMRMTLATRRRSDNPAAYDEMQKWIDVASIAEAKAMPELEKIRKANAARNEQQRRQDEAERTRDEAPEHALELCRAAKRGAPPGRSPHAPAFYSRGLRFDVAIGVDENGRATNVDVTNFREDPQLSKGGASTIDYFWKHQLFRPATRYDATTGTCTTVAGTYVMHHDPDP